MLYKDLKREWNDMEYPLILFGIYECAKTKQTLTFNFILPSQWILFSQYSGIYE